MKNYRNLWLRNVVAFCLVTAVFVSSTLTAFAKTGNTSLAGELIISGHNLNNSESSVQLDGENALSGRTVFSGSVITTSENATATVRLGKLGYLNLSPNSVLNLSFDENSISGTLSAGEVEVFNSENVKVNIEKTGNAKVKAAQDDDDDDNSPVVPLLIFAGIVTGVVIYVITKGDDDDRVVSPIR
jgi:hypothetical protein